MTSSTPSAPINSSRGALDTTAGLIYFFTPSAQVRVPVGDLVFPPPFSDHTILLGGKLTGGGKIIPRRHENFPAAVYISRAGAGGPKIRKKLTAPKLSHSAKNTLFHIFIPWAKLYPIFIHWTELYPIFKPWTELYLILIPCRTVPYLNTLSWTIPYLNTSSRTTRYLNTLNRTIPYLNTLSRTIPCRLTLSRTIPSLNTLSRTIPYLNTLNRIIPYLNTLRKNTNLTENQILVGSQSESSTKKP